jgi:hypothetical protein
MTHHQVLSLHACSSASRAGSIITCAPVIRPSIGNSARQPLMGEWDILEDSFSLVGTAKRIALPDIIHKSVHLHISKVMNKTYQALY